MYNAAIKLTAIALIFNIFPSCADNNGEKAKELLNSAETCISSGNYSQAITLLDSLQHAYPKEIEIQRNAMHLRPKAIEGQTLIETERNDSLIAMLEAEHNSLKNDFSLVNNPELLEGYYVITEFNKPIFDHTTIQPRLSAQGEFYIVSSLNGNPIKHTAITLSKGNENATTPHVDYDGERNYRSGKTEMITFMPAECDSIGQFASRFDNSKLTLKFIGKRTYDTTLSAKETNAIATTYKMSQILSRLKKARLKKELLEQQLLLARDHIARTYQDTATKE